MKNVHLTKVVADLRLNHAGRGRIGAAKVFQNTPLSFSLSPPLSVSSVALSRPSHCDVFVQGWDAE